MRRGCDQIGGVSHTSPGSMVGAHTERESVRQDSKSISATVRGENLEKRLTAKNNTAVIV